MKIALTGATGFVGRHVLDELTRRGLAATLLVRPSTRLPDAWAGHDVVRFDLGDASGRDFAAAGRPDVMIHLAWDGLPNYGSPHHVEQELPAHLGWLKGMLGAGLRHIVVAGTCFEYGMQSGLLGEGLSTQPANAYGRAKDQLRRQLEALCEARPDPARFALTWARLFYMHGEGQSPNALWPQLRSAVARGDAAFAMSGGEQLRDYLSVAEVARRLVDLALVGQGAGVVNVCSGQPVSVRALVESWIAANDWRIAPDYGRRPYSENEPMAFWGDASKLERLVGTR